MTLKKGISIHNIYTFRKTNVSEHIVIIIKNKVYHYKVIKNKVLVEKEMLISYNR